MPRPWAYFDTSVLVKRYVREDGMVLARALLRRYRLLSSAIAPVELRSALCRRRADGDLAEGHFTAILSRIRQDRAHWELVELSPTVLGHAEELIQRSGIRTVDALHLASALTFRSLTGIRLAFITADDRQRQAAEREALAVEWVG